MTIRNFIAEINKYSSTGTPFFFLIDFEMKKPFACRLEDAGKENIFYSIKGKTNYTGSAENRVVRITGKKPVPKTEYSTAFDFVQSNLTG